MKNSLLRALALSNQGLASPNQFGTGLLAVHKVIEHLGYVQIDTLSVVERAHHHILWSRIPDYNLCYLNQLVSKQHIFEYWYHAASYLPMRDYRFALPNMLSIRKGENRYYRDIDERMMNEILAQVRAEGALRARDLAMGKKGKDDLWNTRPARRALDKLFMQGDLMICGRNGMEKIYDLTERCLPENIDLSMPSLSEYAGYLFDTTLRSHGVFTLKQLLHLKTGKPIRVAMNKILDQRIESGLVKKIKNVDLTPIYIDIKALEQLPVIDTQSVKVLSPFDNVVIHRDRLNLLFGFDYRIECYVPAPKRLYGYFCLPILFGDKFVGRIDCKVHRAEQRFEVLNMHFEEGPLDKNQFIPLLNVELQKFADFNQCSKLDAIKING